MLLPISEYEEIHIKFMKRWDNKNGPILAHQAFVNTEKGRELLINKIRNEEFGVCKLCSNPLVPTGRGNKPGINKTYVKCVSCNKTHYKTNIDGANFGTWLNEKIISKILY